MTTHLSSESAKSVARRLDERLKGKQVISVIEKEQAVLFEYSDGTKVSVAGVHFWSHPRGSVDGN